MHPVSGGFVGEMLDGPNQISHRAVVTRDCPPYEGGLSSSLGPIRLRSSVVSPAMSSRVWSAES